YESSKRDTAPRASSRSRAVTALAEARFDASEQAANVRDVGVLDERDYEQRVERIGPVVPAGHPAGDDQGTGDRRADDRHERHHACRGNDGNRDDGEDERKQGRQAKYATECCRYAPSTTEAREHRPHMPNYRSTRASEVGRASCRE